MLATGSSMAAAQPTHNLWVMWESSGLRDEACEATGRLDCRSTEEFRSHFLFRLPLQDAATFFNQMRPHAMAYGSADIRHSRLPICMDDIDREVGDGLADMATPIETLEGLDGVNGDFRAVKGPSSFSGVFGEAANDVLRRTLEKAGIPLLARAIMETTPGQPELVLRFSPEVVDCRPWSVSLSLFQTLVLDRDRGKSIRAGTWSASSAANPENTLFTPVDAVQVVMDAFVKAWAEANFTSPGE